MFTCWARWDVCDNRYGVCVVPKKIVYIARDLFSSNTVRKRRVDHQGLVVNGNELCVTNQNSPRQGPGYDSLREGIHFTMKKKYSILHRYELGIFMDDPRRIWKYQWSKSEENGSLFIHSYSHLLSKLNTVLNPCSSYDIYNIFRNMITWYWMLNRVSVSGS